MGSTGLVLFAVLALVAMAGGVIWLLRDDFASHRRARTDLATCEAIWALTPDR